MSAVPVYRGRFGPAQAERLLWRAGFGPRPGEAKKLAANRSTRGGEVADTAGAGAAARPSAERRRTGGCSHLRTPGATTTSGGSTGWCDEPPEERMTLVWHDWFATSNAASALSRLMLRQNKLFRRNALGSFRDLLLDVTQDPAMLMWLPATRTRRARRTRTTRAS